MRVVVFIIALGLTMTASAQKPSLNGRYKLSIKGDYYTYIFSNDSMLSIIHGSDTAFAKFSVDTTQTPMHINMAMLDEVGLESYTAPGIYEWVGTDKIRLRFSNDLVARPISFLPKGNEETVMLVREK
jgi:hypothetical protein